jgi:hypothetical protein
MSYIRVTRDNGCWDNDPNDLFTNPKKNIFRLIPEEEVEEIIEKLKEPVLAPVIPAVIPPVSPTRLVEKQNALPYKKRPIEEESSSLPVKKHTIEEEPRESTTTSQSTIPPVVLYAKVLKPKQIYGMDDVAELMAHIAVHMKKVPSIVLVFPHFKVVFEFGLASKLVVNNK